MLIGMLLVVMTAPRGRCGFHSDELIVGVWPTSRFPPSAFALLNQEYAVCVKANGPRG